MPDYENYNSFILKKETLMKKQNKEDCIIHKKLEWLKKYQVRGTNHQHFESYWIVFLNRMRSQGKEHPFVKILKEPLVKKI
jgi:hypothetical protein